jgi:hypothetical protein
MTSARPADTTGLESAIKMARKKGVDTSRAEVQLEQLLAEKRRSLVEHERAELDDRGVTGDATKYGSKVSQLREQFSGQRRVPDTLPENGSKLQPSPSRVRVPETEEIQVRNKGKSWLFC